MNENTNGDMMKVTIGDVRYNSSIGLFRIDFTYEGIEDYVEVGIAITVDELKRIIRDKVKLLDNLVGLRNKVLEV